MKRTSLAVAAAAIAALAIGASSSSFSQSVGVQVGPVGAGITIAPEQRTKIKQFVVQEKVKPVTLKERVAVGATLPADVELVTVPSTWGPDLVKYRYVYSDNRVVLVEPSSRKVIEVIE